MLVYDIGGNTVGFADGREKDLDTGGPVDVIYLDYDGGNGAGSISTLGQFASAVAHEYTHLIHLGYLSHYLATTGRHPPEAFFIVEGVAQASMVALGWSDANPPDFYASSYELSLPLFYWRGRGDPFFRHDYWRSGLFHVYLMDRFGSEVIREIMKNGGDNLHGASNLRDALGAFGATLYDVILDFHMANYLNDRSINAGFGYSTEGFTMHRFADVPGAHAAVVDGSVLSATPETEDRVRAGAVRYVRWENVSNLLLGADAVAEESLLDAARTRLRFRVILEPADGPIEIRAVNPGPDSILFSGSYDRLTLMVGHIDPESGPIDFRYDASWGVENVATEEVVSAETLALSPAFPNPFGSSTTLSFTLPETVNVRVTVYDLLGREVALLLNERRQPGRYAVEWEATGLPSGAYVVRLTAAGKHASSRLVLLANGR